MTPDSREARIEAEAVTDASAMIEACRETAKSGGFYGPHFMAEKRRKLVAEAADCLAGYERRESEHFLALFHASHVIGCARNADRMTPELEHVGRAICRECPSPCTEADEAARKARASNDSGEAAELKRLQATIERERSNAAKWLSRIEAEIQKREHLIEGRGLYEWDDDRYRLEFSEAIKAIRSACAKAADGCNIRSFEDCPKTQAEVAAARAPQPAPDRVSRIEAELSDCGAENKNIESWECILKAGHPGPHDDGAGSRWKDSTASPSVTELARVVRALDTLFAGVDHGVEGWNSALIAAAKAWNREGE